MQPMDHSNASRFSTDIPPGSNRTTIAAWVLFATRRHAAARWVNRVPLPWVTVGLVLLVWILLAG